MGPFLLFPSVGLCLFLAERGVKKIRKNCKNIFIYYFFCRSSDMLTFVDKCFRYVTFPICGGINIFVYMCTLFAAIKPRKGEKFWSTICWLWRGVWWEKAVWKAEVTSYDIWCLQKRCSSFTSCSPFVRVDAAAKKLLYDCSYGGEENTLKSDWRWKLIKSCHIVFLIYSPLEFFS